MIHSWCAVEWTTSPALVDLAQLIFPGPVPGFDERETANTQENRVALVEAIVVFQIYLKIVTDGNSTHHDQEPQRSLQTLEDVRIRYLSELARKVRPLFLLRRRVLRLTMERFSGSPDPEPVSITYQRHLRQNARARPSAVTVSEVQQQHQQQQQQPLPSDGFNDADVDPLVDDLETVQCADRDMPFNDYMQSLSTIPQTLAPFITNVSVGLHELESFVNDDLAGEDNDARHHFVTEVAPEILVDTSNTLSSAQHALTKAQTLLSATHRRANLSAKEVVAAATATAPTEYYSRPLLLGDRMFTTTSMIGKHMTRTPHSVLPLAHPCLYKFYADNCIHYGTCCLSNDGDKDAPGNGAPYRWWCVFTGQRIETPLQGAYLVLFFAAHPPIVLVVAYESFRRQQRRLRDLFASRVFGSGIRSRFESREIEIEFARYFSIRSRVSSLLPPSSLRLENLSVPYRSESEMNFLSVIKQTAGARELLERPPARTIAAPGSDVDANMDVDSGADNTAVVVVDKPSAAAAAAQPPPPRRFALSRIMENDDDEENGANGDVVASPAPPPPRPRVASSAKVATTKGSGGGGGGSPAPAAKKGGSSSSITTSKTQSLDKDAVRDIVSEIIAREMPKYITRMVSRELKVLVGKEARLIIARSFADASDSLNAFVMKRYFGKDTLAADIDDDDEDEEDLGDEMEDGEDDDDDGSNESFAAVSTKKSLGAAIDANKKRHAERNATVMASILSKIAKPGKGAQKTDDLQQTNALAFVDVDASEDEELDSNDELHDFVVDEDEVEYASDNELVDPKRRAKKRKTAEPIDVFFWSDPERMPSDYVCVTSLLGVASSLVGYITRRTELSDEEAITYEALLTGAATRTREYDRIARSPKSSTDGPLFKAIRELRALLVCLFHRKPDADMLSTLANRGQNWIDCKDAYDEWVEDWCVRDGFQKAISVIRSDARFITHRPFLHDVSEYSDTTSKNDAKRKKVVQKLYQAISPAGRKLIACLFYSTSDVDDGDDDDNEYAEVDGAVEEEAGDVGEEESEDDENTEEPGDENTQ